MTDLTTANLRATVNHTLQEILAKDSSILSWKSKKIPNAVILKFQDRRYLGLPRKDKKGQEYWRYHLLTQPVGSPSQNQVKNHESNNPTNNPEQ